MAALSADPPDTTVARLGAQATIPRLVVAVLLLSALAAPERTLGAAR